MQLIGSPHFLVLFSRIWTVPSWKGAAVAGPFCLKKEKKKENMDSCVFDPDVSVCLGRICYFCLYSSGELTTVFVIHISHIILSKDSIIEAFKTSWAYHTICHSHRFSQKTILS